MEKANLASILIGVSLIIMAPRIVTAQPIEPDTQATSAGSNAAIFLDEIALLVAGTGLIVITRFASRRRANR